MFRELWSKWYYRFAFLEVANVWLSPFLIPRSTIDYIDMLTTGSRVYSFDGSSVWVHAIPSAALEYQANRDFVVYLVLSQLAVLLLTIFARGKGLRLLAGVLDAFFCEGEREVRERNPHDEKCK